MARKILVVHVFLYLSCYSRDSNQDVSFLSQRTVLVVVDDTGPEIEEFFSPRMSLFILIRGAVKVSTFA